MRSSALAVALLLFLSSVAEAHARYERSEPGDGATVSDAPVQVEIWFSQELFRREGENWIHVFGPENEAIHSGEARIDDDERSLMWVELQTPLKPGSYRVEWRNLSAEDGDTDEGEFTFVYDPQAQVTSTPMLAETATSSSTASSTADREVRTATVIPDVATREEDEAGGGCALGLIPALAVAPLGLGLRRWRDSKS